MATASIRLEVDTKTGKVNVKELSEEFEKLDRKRKTTQDGLSSLVKISAGVFAGLSADRMLRGLTGGLVDAGKAAVALAGRFQQTQVAFATMLGSGEKAKAFLDELSAFAARTPFQFPDLVQASQRLLGMGFAAKDIIPTMTAIGDAVAGLGGGSEMIQRVTVALGQMQAKGKVSAEEMMQLAETGIPVWQILADKIGKTVPEAMKLASQGAISAKVGIDALVSGMGEKFQGLMEKQSQTLLGMISTLKDNFEIVLRDIGTAVLPAVTEIVAGLGEATAEVGQFVSENKAALNDLAVDGFRTLFDSVSGVIRIFQLAKETTAELKNEFKEFGLELPKLPPALQEIVDLLEKLSGPRAVMMAPLELLKGLGEVGRNPTLKAAVGDYRDLEKAGMAVKKAIGDVNAETLKWAESNAKAGKSGKPSFEGKEAEKLAKTWHTVNDAFNRYLASAERAREQQWAKDAKEDADEYAESLEAAARELNTMLLMSGEITGKVGAAFDKFFADMDKNWDAAFKSRDDFFEKMSRDWAAAIQKHEEFRGALGALSADLANASDQVGGFLGALLGLGAAGIQVFLNLDRQAATTAQKIEAAGAALNAAVAAYQGGSVLGGVAGGAAAGAAFGPVGAVVGGVVGGILGFFGGKKKEEEERKKKQAELLDSFRDLQKQIEALKMEKLQAGVGGLAALFKNAASSVDLTQERLDRLGVLGGALFQQLRKQGMSVVEAMKAMSPALDEAIAAAEKSGLQITGVLGTLADFRAKVLANEDLVNAAEGLSAMMEALRATGSLTQENFAALQGELGAVFDELVAKGFTAGEAGNEALALIAPTLLQIRDAAKEGKIAVDESTQALIDQAEAAGLFEGLTDPMQELLEVQQLMLQTVAAMAQVFGAVLPAEVQKYIDSLNKIPAVPGPPGFGGGGGSPLETGGVTGGSTKGLPLETASVGMAKRLKRDTMILAHAGEYAFISPKAMDYISARNGLFDDIRFREREPREPRPLPGGAGGGDTLGGVGAIVGDTDLGGRSRRGGASTSEIGALLDEIMKRAKTVAAPNVTMAPQITVSENPLGTRQSREALRSYTISEVIKEMQDRNPAMVDAIRRAMR